MIPRTAEYALRALAMLALHPDEPLRTAQIADQCDIPERYLSAVMRDQVRAGLVRSQRGRNGGYTLAGPPESIHLDDVLKAAGFDVTSRPCGFGWASCDRDDPCPLHPLFVELNAALEQWALGRTLGEVEPGRWPIDRSPA